MTVAFFTLGCKVNQYETNLLKEQFEKAGYTLVKESASADFYIINSCTVTATADKKIRNIARRFKKLNPFSTVVIIGCFPQAFRDEATAISEADIVWGTKDKSSLISYLTEIGERIVNVSSHSEEDVFEGGSITHYEDKTRAFVKVQDGCDRYCAYCIIPYARGRVRSKAVLDAVSEVSALVSSGHKEVVLVGINLSMYGKDINSNLVELIKALSEIEGLNRIRLGSTEPMLVTAEDFKELSKYEKLCPHFHIALQSGADSTLKRMNRPYTTTEYREIVGAVYKYFKNPAITTDVIVGFVGESEEEFLQTVDFLKEIKPSDMHIFPFSKRKGTAAYDMVDDVPVHVKKERVKKLTELSNELKSDFLKNQIGSVANVIFERTVNEHGRKAHSDNYTVIYVNDPEALAGKMQKVKITKAFADFCIGEIIKD